MIDLFSRQRFESMLPVHKDTGKPLWQGLGVRNGEYCYVIPVQQGVLIYIRSSVRESGFAADIAEDSIRCWLAEDITGRALGSKAARYITRVNGWDRRLTEQLRMLWQIGRKLKPCTQAVHAHDQFATLMHAYRVKKDGPNKGRWFTKCPECGHFGEWLTEPETVKESK